MFNWEQTPAPERVESARLPGGKSGSGKLPQPEEKGRTRDKVADALGVSGKTYEKAKQVVEAAADESLGECVATWTTQDLTAELDDDRLRSTLGQLGRQISERKPG